MHVHAKGAVLAEDDLTVGRAGLDALARALGTPSGAQTATLVPFFGPVVGGDSQVVDVLGLDLSRALLGGIGYEWQRPFEPGETVHVRVVVEDVYPKGSNQFGVVIAEFTDAEGALIQRQSATFVERGAK